MFSVVISYLLFCLLFLVPFPDTIHPGFLVSFAFPSPISISRRGYRGRVWSRLALLKSPRHTQMRWRNVSFRTLPDKVREMASGGALHHV